MRYVLFRTGQHHSQPIQRVDIAALISKKYPGQARQGLTGLVIAKAQGQFAEIMGKELRELVRKTEAGESGPRSYVLRSLLPQRFRDALVGPQRAGQKQRQERDQEKSILLTILMMISLSGDQMTEAKLWEHLNLLGIEKDTKHGVFGDAASVLHRFVRQRYLQKVAKKSDTGRVWLYQPGENALDEIDQVSLSEAISKVNERASARETIQTQTKPYQTTRSWALSLSQSPRIDSPSLPSLHYITDTYCACLPQTLQKGHNVSEMIEID